MLLHRMLVSSMDTVDEVHLIKCQPNDWVQLVQIESCIREARHAESDVPQYLLVADHVWRKASFEADGMIRKAKMTSYDSLLEFVEFHIQQAFEGHTELLERAQSGLAPVLRVERVRPTVESQ